MKSLKIILFILFGLIGSTAAVRAQDEPRPEALEKIRSMQIAYLSKELDLTQDEAQKFWPVYNQYSKEVEALITERKQTMQQIHKSSTSAEDPSAQVSSELAYQQRMVDIKTRYKDQFMRVLPPQKVNTLYRAERDFRAQLIRQLKERQEGRPGGFRRMRQ
ncbi:hypothetical protein GA0116948_10628 [Chitinophaga costaii]|uniref:LTXXQ motif family protein n=1 Tax=Chitinophaga costaii TaxID=1335309 RepID=A0A1C4DPE5_9BACT|nr:hypothetical protein [Chitinophaga costaii]PUZ27723.1 hypothetical protein DCM91_05790 [Chitinophaga costaii]SCC33161.1 hypothetical protein GA0116948_10628 [Chitinophaga costaii]